MASDERVPLTTLLSQVLIAYTIELDNEFERRLAEHVPLRYVARRFQVDPSSRERGVLTVSMTLWFNFMRAVGAEPRTVGEIEHEVGVAVDTQGMERWGYIRAEPGDDRRTLKRGSFGDLQGGATPGWLVHATPAGVLATSLWEALVLEIDDRWQSRFGDAFAELREALLVCRAVVGPGLPLAFTRAPISPADPPERDDSELAFASLVSQMLQALTLEVETATDARLSVSANLLTVLRSGDVPVRDLSRATGIATRNGRFPWLGGPYTEGLVDVADGRAHLSRAGNEAVAGLESTINAIEDRWKRAVPLRAMSRLRRALLELIGSPDGLVAPDAPWLAADPTCWRSRVRTPARLPGHPMQWQRAFPDNWDP